MAENQPALNPLQLEKKIKVTTRFMSGKLLMFAKLSLKSFIYDLSETFFSQTKWLLTYTKNI